MTPERKLAAIASIIVGGEPTSSLPGPGIVPAEPAAPTKWWRSPGAPLVEPVPTAYDDIPTCKRYAAQGYGPGGTRRLVEPDLSLALAMADALGSDTQTAKGAEDLLEGAGSSDTSSVIYALLTGWAQGFPVGLGGRPRLYIGEQRIADLVAQSKSHAGPGPGIG